MAITIDAQIEVDGTPIANGTYRHIVGPISCAVSTGGLKVLACEFIIEGSTPEECATRWATAKAELNKRDPRVIMWVDKENQSTPTEDIRSGDSEHGSVTTRIAFEPMRTQTGYAYACVFTATTELIPAQDTTGTARIPYAGQVGEIEIVTIYNSGAKISRVVRAKFTSTVNKTGYGPFLLNGATVNVGGKAKFILTGTLPTFKDGMTLLLSGTTNYNRPHPVVSISGQNVQTTTDWVSGDAVGTCYLSQVTTGQENYDAARTSLLADFLKVAQYGAYLATDELALTGESIRELDKDGYTIEVLLSADHMPDQLSALPSARHFSFSVKRVQPSGWSLDSGESAPITFSAEGSYGVDMDQLGATALGATWNTIKARIKTVLGTHLGETVKFVSEEHVLNPSSGTVHFFLVMANESATALDFSFSETWSFKLNYRKWKIKNGKHHAQIEPGPQDCVVTQIVSRKGYNQVNLAAVIPPPGQAGFMFLPIGSADTHSDRVELADGSVAWSQSYSATWDRLNTNQNEVIPYQPAVKP